MNALRIIVLITSIMVAMSADAWDATTTFTSGMPAEFAPTALSTPDAHGYWAAGTAGNSPVLVRYDTAMSAQFVRYMQDRFPPSYVALSAVPDGGVIVHEQAILTRQTARYVATTRPAACAGRVMFHLSAKHPTPTTPTAHRSSWMERAVSGLGQAI